MNQLYARSDTTIAAQYLYDLRDATGFISGRDLHDLFRVVTDNGDPSPSGYEVIDLYALIHDAGQAGKDAYEMLTGPLWDTLPTIREYALCPSAHVGGQEVAKQA